MARTTAREVLVSSATQLTTVSGLAEAVHEGGTGTEEPAPGQPVPDDHTIDELDPGHS